MGHVIVNDNFSESLCFEVELLYSECLSKKNGIDFVRRKILLWLATLKVNKCT